MPSFLAFDWLNWNWLVVFAFFLIYAVLLFSHGADE